MKKILLLCMCASVGSTISQKAFSQVLMGDNGTYIVNVSAETNLQSAFDAYFATTTNESYASVKNLGVMGAVSSADFTTIKKLQNVVTVDFVPMGGMMGVGTLPDNKVPDYAFCSGDMLELFGMSKLEEVVLPSTVTAIGAYAFAACPKLAYVDLSAMSALTAISMGAFQGSGIESISLPASVSIIDFSAFDNCRQLTSFSIDAANTTFSAQQNAVYRNATKTLVYYPLYAKNQSLEVKAGIETIGDMTLYGNQSLETVILPTSVKRIGDRAFEDVSNLKSINLPAALSYLGETALAGTALTQVTFPDNLTKLNSGVLARCGQLTSVTLPTKLDTIYSSAFEQAKNLAAISFANTPSLKLLDEKVFMGCNALTSVDLSATALTKVGEKCFEDITGLQQVILPNSVDTIEAMAFYNCEQLNFTFPTSLKYIGSKAFFNNTSLTALALPASLEAIGSAAFAKCTGVKAANISYEGGAFIAMDGIILSGDMSQLVFVATDAAVGSIEGMILGMMTQIPDYAFYQNKDLSNLAFGTGLTEVGNFAFYGCGKVAKVNFSMCDNLTKIGESAFEDNVSLTTLTFDPSATANLTFGKAAFKGCSALNSVVLPAVTNSLGVDMFANCTALKTADLSACKTTYLSAIFNGCSSLTEVKVNHDKITSMGSPMFNGCTSLKSFQIPTRITYGISALQFVGSGVESFSVADASTAYRTIDGVLYKKATQEVVAYPVAKTGDYVIPEGTTKINTNAFVGNQLITKITLPSTLAAPGWNNVQQSFSNMPALKEFALTGSNANLMIVDGGIYDAKGTILFAYVSQANPVFVSTMTTVKDYSFFTNTTVQKVVIPEGVTTVGQQAFAYATALKTVEAPSTITSIGVKSFTDVPLESFTCKATAVPTLGSMAFNAVDDQFVVYVPRDAVDAYKANSSWGVYNIQPIADATGVEEIQQAPATSLKVSYDGTMMRLFAAKEIALVEVYAASGASVLRTNEVSFAADLNAGVYIVRAVFEDQSAEVVKVSVR